MDYGARLFSENESPSDQMFTGEFLPLPQPVIVVQTLCPAI